MSRLHHLFFPQLDLYNKIQGLPTGTGVLTRYCKEQNESPPVDPKTYRKVLNFEPISERSSHSLEKFIDTLTGIEDARTYFTPPQDMLKNQAQWWGYLKGYEAQPENKKFERYIDSSYRLLLAEIAIAAKMRDMKDPLAQPMIYFLSSDYTNYLLSEELPPTYTIKKLKNLTKNTHPRQNMQSDETFRLPFLNGIISLILHLDAAKETDIQTMLLGKPLNKSMFSRFLPSLSDNGKLEYPLKKLLRYWQDQFNITSIEELANSAPTNFGSGLDEKVRKIKYWMSGQYTPDENTETKVEKWISSLSGLDQDDDRVFIELLRFSTACLYQRLIKEVQAYGGITEASSLEPAFKLYEYHYQRHLSDNQLAIRPSDSGPSA